MLALVYGTERARRRQATVAQLVSESAAVSGDVAAALELIDHAIDHGLYDLHWLERCPLLAPVRAAPGFARAHARVKRRAEAILDALYGDYEADTAVL
jgi:eukaryotic-like serine/threonine-protein kinase